MGLECECDVDMMVKIRNDIGFRLLFTRPLGDDPRKVGNTGNALGHCIAACTINQKMPECNERWEKSEYNEQGKPKDIPSLLDILNNGIGRNTKGDCWKGCYDKLKDGGLTCFDKKRGAVPCEP